MQQMTKFAILTVILLIPFYPGITMAQIDRPNEHFVTRSEVIGANGMVAASQPLATQVGLEILKKGGNAIDAAIAANAAIGLMEPTGNGIGGDLFAIIWDVETEQLYALNASGRSPRNLSYEELKSVLLEMKRAEEGASDNAGNTGSGSEINDGRDGSGSDIDPRTLAIPPYSLHSVSVPGAVDGWFEMHERFGAMTMDEILAPAIGYAEEGFPVSEIIADAWQRSVRFLKDQPGAFLETFSIDGRGPERGEIFRNPDLGNTYRLLASNGRDAFYKGGIANNIDAFMREHGGFLRKEDFEAHTSEWVDPISVNYRGYDVHQIGGNNQGTAVLQMLNILEGYDLASLGYNNEKTLHLMIEAKKLAFEDRAKHYADPDFYDIPMDRLLSKEYAAERRELIGERAMDRITSGVRGLEQGGTIYLATADRHGNMVSLIQSNFRGMGTGFVVPGTGFSFQNRGELFSMDPEHPNVYAPGKRPFHTIIPGFVTKNGRPHLSFGVMGGGFQPQGHVQVLVNMIDFGMNLQEAGDAMRWQHNESTEPTDPLAAGLVDGGKVQFESSIEYDVVRALRERGHNVTIGGGFYGRYQAIKRDHDKGVYFGASEPRADGQAAGY